MITSGPKRKLVRLLLKPRPVKRLLQSLPLSLRSSERPKPLQHLHHCLRSQRSKPFPNTKPNRRPSKQLSEVFPRPVSQTRVPETTPNGRTPSHCQRLRRRTFSLLARRLRPRKRRSASRSKFSRLTRDSRMRQEAAGPVVDVATDAVEVIGVRGEVDQEVEVLEATLVAKTTAASVVKTENPVVIGNHVVSAELAALVPVVDATTEPLLSTSPTPRPSPPSADTK